MSGSGTAKKTSSSVSIKTIRSNRVKMKAELYFPTIIFSLDVSDHEEINKSLLDAIYKIKEADGLGVQKSNFRSLGGWHSKSDLHKKPEFERIFSLINAALFDISSELIYDENSKLKVGSMWSIINGPGSFNKSHIHPSSHWSGVYYVNCPRDSGAIEFTDPRTSQLMSPIKYETSRPKPKEVWQNVSYTPTPGKLLIFPSWLYHNVLPNMTSNVGKEGDRVIISFNALQCFPAD